MKRDTLAKPVCGFIVSGLLLAATPAMGEPNYCIITGIPPFDDLVFTNFKVPKPNECTTLVGHQALSVLSGVACTRFDGSLVRFGVTRYEQGNKTLFNIVLQLPQQNGSGDQLALDFRGAFHFTSFAAAGLDCGVAVLVL